MSERSFLLDSEQLLCDMRSTPAVLAQSFLRGLLDTLVIGIAVAALLYGGFYALGWSVPLWLPIACVVIAYGVVAWRRWEMWKHATLQITSERILLHTPGTLFHVPLRTIKWSQYQESYVGHRTFLDFFFRSRSLHIRFGTADAPREFHFPSLRYAEDLKHYLDKIDAAIRHNDAAAVRPFVAKPRGKRDS
jgi:hypothetical protein